ncbi:MAG: hypothetical protein A2600_04645 [Candidatus Lambdaproteobacteria bacterium RIFOXYD1_FULL_56_27]|uniref:Protein phosphatase CheZ n=1 Tax=Candidatus Lambdaproteobacteria bacterium RIFOXYD2_FULL_56_26 TaxID=1817773 RepID=A0A1F6H3V6_9PROT|nr:MAG: hypothetical protein A2426_13710 [Candidatus Lambdaproteobacteria bacterium RIFOXYC1_FULL_56_13]OGH05043.1 MAG: hypothetical protein A2557_08710 [Candidatus Lambdaproteobacteria bacterium RIFOXYD2_FULL_56_26]OGH09508.1 MAG: hypothetical protein A2600_04645 [Candidatus Lambdaproteobacteria bacterium RIFOXYD1_FULL_56_27]
MTESSNSKIIPLQEKLGELFADLPQLGGSASMQAFLDKLQQLLVGLEVLEEGKVRELLAPLAAQGDNPLFGDLAKLLRRFHDQMTQLRDSLPQRIEQLDAEALGGMSERLRHILELTENAANKTLDLAEEGLASMAEDAAQLGAFQNALKQLSQDPTLGDAAKALVSQGLNILGQVEKRHLTQQDRFNQILLAQDYQDLTGQLIQKVLNLLCQMEGDLVLLVKHYGQAQAKPMPTKGTALQGPLKDDHADRHGQDDVNALLGSFGF